MTDRDDLDDEMEYRITDDGKLERIKAEDADFEEDLTFD